MKGYDLAIIGAGPGGYVSAIYASRLNLKVCIIEQDLLGGTCLNRGCIPTKVMLEGAKLLASLEKASSYGVEVKDYAFSPARLFSKRDEVTARLRNGIQHLLKANKVDVIKGRGVLVSANVVSAGGGEIEAKNIIVATGSSPRELDSVKFRKDRVLSSDDVLRLSHIPKSMLIFGGGVIGCEFAEFYNAAGSRVYIVEIMDRILPGEDAEIARKLEAIFRKKGIEIHTGKKAEGVSVTDSSVSVTFQDNTRVEAEVALLAVGRGFNTSGLGLEEAGVALDRGRITVDPYMETKVKGIYAIGDCTGGPMLAHAASYEGIVACDNIAGKRRRVNYSAIPNCVYTEPEIASCGISEEEAKRDFPDCRTAKFPYTASSKASIMERREGFIKIIGTKEGRLLGVKIFGEGACDLIGEASLAVSLGAGVEDIARAVHGHPTLSEIFGDAAYLFMGRAIHTV